MDFDALTGDAGVLLLATKAMRSPGGADGLFAPAWLAASGLASGPCVHSYLKAAIAAAEADLPGVLEWLLQHYIAAGKGDKEDFADICREYEFDTDAMTVRVAASRGHIPVLVWLCRLFGEDALDTFRQCEALSCAAARGQLAVMEWMHKHFNGAFAAPSPGAADDRAGKLAQQADDDAIAEWLGLREQN
jgi:hypothetical protein